MSNKKNYRKMYPAEDERVTSPEEVVTEAEPEVTEKPVKRKAPKTTIGVVANCAKLNVREQMHTTAAVLCVLSAGSEVKVFTEESHPEWAHVITSTGVEGFCMKQYIKI